MFSHWLSPWTLFRNRTDDNKSWNDNVFLFLLLLSEETSVSFPVPPQSGENRSCSSVPKILFVSFIDIVHNPLLCHPGLRPSLCWNKLFIKMTLSEMNATFVLEGWRKVLTLIPRDEPTRLTTEFPTYESPRGSSPASNRLLEFSTWATDLRGSSWTSSKQCRFRHSVTGSSSDRSMQLNWSALIKSIPP